MGSSAGVFEPGMLANAQPYFVAGRTAIAGVTAAAGEPIARLMHFGYINPANPGAGVQATPIRISQIRVRLARLAAATTVATAFEILKGTATAQASGAGTLHLPQSRKTTGYPAITAAETSLYVSNTDDITGGTFTPNDASGPIDIATLANGGSVWVPADFIPLQLEAGEAIEIRCLAFEAALIAAIAFDFVR